MVVFFILDLRFFHLSIIPEVFPKKTHESGAAIMNWTFDWNEWFMIITSFIAFSIVLFIRKHFQPVVFIVIWLYSIAFVETIDYALAGSPFKTYFCADNYTYEPVAALIHIFLYPSFSFIFLFFYSKWNLHGGKLILYILAFTVFSLFFEWLNIINDVFTYTGWKLFYSIPTYPIASWLLIKVFHFIERHLAEPLPE
jgi:hypothetical protein